jgi:hypothetical protein
MSNAEKESYLQSYDTFEDYLEMCTNGLLAFCAVLRAACVCALIVAQALASSPVALFSL